MPKTNNPADDVFLSARQVLDRYGVSAMSLWRWLRDDKLNFPAPIYIGRFRYWRAADLFAWERALARKSITRDEHPSKVVAAR